MNGLFGKYQVILAPMAGITDSAMRMLCLEQGADIAFTEMVSAKGLSYENEKTHHLLDLSPGEESVAVQLFGHEPETMAQQARKIEGELGEGLAFIDINMGCPARKIVTKGDGAALMKNPSLACEIISAVRESVSCPVTAKFRRGWEIGNETAPAFASALESAGVSAVTVHGRFAEQLYHGNACWDTIKRVKQTVSVPVVGNGDVKCGDDAVAMAAQTGCDALMVARAAQGNPWVFAHIKAALEGRELPDSPTVEERLAMAKRHTALLEQLYGKRIVRMRKHAMWYVAGLPGASKARGLFSVCTTREEFDQVFDELSSYAS